MINVGKKTPKKLALATSFLYFTWGIHLEANSSGYRGTWMEI